MCSAIPTDTELENILGSKLCLIEALTKLGEKTSYEISLVVYLSIDCPLKEKVSRAPGLNFNT